MEKKCPNCTKVFRVKPSESHKYRFCGHSCRKEYTRKSRKTLCKTCETIFYPEKRKNRKDQQFCSQKCMGQYCAVLDYDNSYISNVRNFVDGFLVSDGSISKLNCHMCWSVKYKEFDTYIKRKLSDYAPSSKRVFQKDIRAKQGGYMTFKGRTKCHPDIKKERNRWYKQGKKIVPRNIAMNRNMFMTWYLGDGVNCSPNKIELCTDSFGENEVEFLIRKLHKIGLASSRKRHHCKKPRIRIDKCEAFALIGNKSPIECYGYKFQ